MAGHTVTRPRAEKTQRYVFYLGVVLAAIAAIVVFVAINAADSGGTGDNVAVVLASQDIPAQTRITNDLLKVEFLSADEANPDAFSSRSQLLDRVVTEDVGADAQVLPSMVSDVAGDGLAFKVDPGMRGVSVEVSEVVIAGGNIKPGDRVDVVGVFEVSSVAAANDVLDQFGTDYTISQAPSAASAEEGGTNRFVLTTTLLQNVKVLGLAQTLTPTTSGGTLAEDVKEADTEPRASTATLQVTPDQAQMLTTADEHGILRLGVRPPGDQANVEIEPTLVVVE